MTTRAALKARLVALETQARMIGRRPPALVIVDQGKVTVDGHPGAFENLDAALTWLVDTLGEPAAPDVALHICWPGDPIPTDCDEVIELKWPEDVQNGDLSDSRPLGLSKAYLNPLRAL